MKFVKKQGIDYYTNGSCPIFLTSLLKSLYVILLFLDVKKVGVSSWYQSRGLRDSSIRAKMLELKPKARMKVCSFRSAMQVSKS
ncbi:hypothetical protein HanPSC8_Chr13g0554161 [Helianthus annuus]|nr:hypothetical protein HanPSC8_Chr13g0554161 [Helianthus annuus]